MAAVSAPKGLGTAGRRLWRSLQAEFEFTSAETIILAAAARQADDIERLEALLANSIETTGSKGQTRLSGAVTEVRQGRVALARLLSELRLPNVDETTGVNTSRQRAAKARWDRERRRLAVVRDHAGAEGRT
jgi:hypothetical protein